MLNYLITPRKNIHSSHLFFLVFASAIFLFTIYSDCDVWQKNDGIISMSPAPVQRTRALKCMDESLPMQSQHPRRSLKELEEDTIPRHMPSPSQQKNRSLGENRGLTQVWYSTLGSDRSGSVIKDMLYAHAWAFRHNTTYGGACDDKKNKKMQSRVSIHREMIKTLGLSDTLKIACPKNKTNTRLVHTREYFRHRMGLWKKPWINNIRTQQKLTHPQNISAKVAVHVRRGDVKLCSKKGDRYLPNSHYLRLLKKYFPNVPKDQVTIFSESQSYGSGKSIVEPWDDFGGYNLRLDGDPADVWKAGVAADGFILSRSTFSLIPAIFNRNGTIVFNKFSFPSLPGWHHVNKHMMKMASSDARKLRVKLCTSNKTVKSNT